MMKGWHLALVALGCVIGLCTNPVWAGPVFLTGHDPDFHAQSSVGAQNLLSTGLDFVTNGTFDDASPVKRFLWVESRIAPPGGHLVGEDGLTAIGLALGAQYDRANAAEFATVNLSNYSAIAIASTFGGLLGQAELDALIARKADIQSFINAGGGLLALAECFPDSGHCQADLLGPAPNLFGFLPVTVSSVPTINQYFVTPYGASLGLTDADVNDPTHNSFGLIGGLNVVDVDAANTPTTLAGIVTVGDGGFTPIPEPTTWLLFSTGLVGLAVWGTRKRHRFDQ